MTRTLTLSISTLALTVACGGTANDELLEAIPDQDSAIVALPGETGSTSSSLSAGDVGSTSSALVGGPANYYTLTYQHARHLNNLGRSVILLLESITRYPATERTPDRAVWGPGSDAADPNEYRLIIERAAPLSSVLLWNIAGRHKSATDFSVLASGAFDKKAGLRGKGWFVIDFDAIGALDPAEDGTGTIAYAFERTGGGTRVLASADTVDELGNPLVAGYAFGRDADGSGFILFGVPVDIHDNDPTMPAREDLALLTRWTTDNPGRVDVVAAHGDLGSSVVHVAQCWGERFTSTYESLHIDGRLKKEDGDIKTCSLDDAEAPDAAALPTAEDVANPHN